MMIGSGIALSLGSPGLISNSLSLIARIEAMTAEEKALKSELQALCSDNAKKVACLPANNSFFWK